MQIPQLTKYILEELERGTPELAIKQKLFQSKWLPEEIEENYSYALLEAQKLISNYQPSKKISKRKILIQAMVIILLLLASAVAFVTFFRQPQQSTEEMVANELNEIENIPSPPSVTQTPTPKPIIAVNNINDKKREQDRIVIQAALRRYFSDQGFYPQTLIEMEDKGYLITLPNDVTTNNPYTYEKLQNGRDYKLCIDYEEQGLTCFNRLSN